MVGDAAAARAAAVEAGVVDEVLKPDVVVGLAVVVLELVLLVDDDVFDVVELLIDEIVDVGTRGSNGTEDRMSLVSTSILPTLTLSCLRWAVTYVS